MLITLYLIISFGFKVRDKFPEMSNTAMRDMLKVQLSGRLDQREGDDDKNATSKFGFGRRKGKEAEKGKLRLTRKGRREGREEKEDMASMDQELAVMSRSNGRDSNGPDISKKPVQYMGELWKRERNGGDSAFSKVFVVLESGVLDFYASKKDYLDFANALNDYEIQVMQFTLEIENLVWCVCL